MKTDKYLIRWQYDRTQNSPTRFTYCYLLDGEYGVSVGYARCTVNDNFDKDKGRKISLARVLKKAEIPKEERTKIWETYRTMSPKGRW